MNILSGSLLKIKLQSFVIEINVLKPSSSYRGQRIRRKAPVQISKRRLTPEQMRKVKF